MTHFWFLDLTRGEDLGYNIYMITYTDDSVESAKVAEALEILERLGMLNNIWSIETPYKQGDLYKEIIEGTGENPPNESP